jgi:hypothetical protein
MRPRRGEFRASASTIACFGALAVESGACFARGGPSRAGFGSGLPRIAYSRKYALDVAIFAPASTIPCFDALAVESDA